MRVRRQSAIERVALRVGFVALSCIACAPTPKEIVGPPRAVETTQRPPLFDVGEAHYHGLPDQSDEPGIGSAEPPRSERPPPPREAKVDTHHRVRADVVSMQGAGGPPLAALLRAKVRRCAEKLDPPAIGSVHIDFTIDRDGIARNVVVRGIDGIAECVRRSIATSSAFSPSDVELPISVELVIIEQPT